MASNECPMDDILSSYNVAPSTGFHSILDVLHDLHKPPHLLAGKCSFWKKGVVTTQFEKQLNLYFGQFFDLVGGSIDHHN